jgi:hypothetical protein
MITGCEKQTEAWEFMKWHTGESNQIKYANELVSIIGNSGKYASANYDAIQSMTWTPAEYTQIMKQFNSLAAIPNYPGSYILARYTSFAFLEAYNDGADPIEALQKYITTINKEIQRKREEFKLETLDDEWGTFMTLADKRLHQAEVALDEAVEASSYSGSYDSVVAQVRSALATGDDYIEMNAAVTALKEADATLFASVISYLKDATYWLEWYESQS